MKLRFITLTLLLLFARGCDFYSTSLWFFQENGISNEMNPLTQVFGAGWNSLIVTNIIICTLIIGAFYYYCFKYKPMRNLKSVPQNYKEYASLQYFNRPDAFFQIFYKIPKNNKVIIAHLGYVLIRVLIIASFLATIHNLSQYYNLEYYNTFRNLVKRPLFVIYGFIFIFLVWVYLNLLMKEYQDLNREKQLT